MCCSWNIVCYVYFKTQIVYGLQTNLKFFLSVKVFNSQHIQIFIIIKNNVMAPINNIIILHINLHFN